MIEPRNTGEHSPGVGRRPLLRVLLMSLCFSVLAGCSSSYRVGDHVLVEWGDEGHVYPAFIIQKKEGSRFRVHYEGYPSRWDEDVPLPRIVGRVTGPVNPPPPPKKVRLAQGLDKDRDDSAPVSRYKEGDLVRVKWRGSVYRAVVLEVVSPGEFKVHYEGHEEAWDEVIAVSRIVTTP